MTLRAKTTLMCAALVAITAGPSIVSAQTAAAKAAIDAGNKKFSDAVASGNAASVAGLFTEDATVMPPNSEPVKGRPAIEKLFQAMIAAGIKGVALTAQEVEAHGDTATEVGVYSVKDSTGKEMDRGKYMTVWKRAQGQWKLHRDIWNSSMPAGMPPK